MQKNKFYVTTPIYYVNAAPHLGSLYSTLLADVVARYHKLMGEDVFFLTGTDEHGQKIAEAAKKAGKNPKEFVDQFIPAYQNIWKMYEIEYTKFIRTTDAYHVTAVQNWISKLTQQGDIYKGVYTGWYCTPCERFVTEKDQLENAKEITCPVCLRPCNQISEECYFFKLSAYQDRLLEFYEKNPNFMAPKERLNEVIAFVKEDLKDLSISRTTVSWGIPFPGDDKHVTYVWADALNNYITAIGYGNQDGQQELQKWWPADLQILGKDIVRFHAVYWPAFLMASGLQMPKKLLVHGWIKVGEQKMSKSLGNAVDPKILADHYGVDQIRYYLIAKMAITHDSEFSTTEIEQTINSELANDLGNLLNRCSTLAEKFDYTQIQAPVTWSKDGAALKKSCEAMQDDVLDLVQEGFCHRAVQRIWEFIAETNAYFHNHEPWKAAKNNIPSSLQSTLGSFDGQAALTVPAIAKGDGWVGDPVIDKSFLSFQEIIAATAYSIRTIGVLLWPVMPKKMEQLLASLDYELPFPSSPATTGDPVIYKKSLNIFEQLAWTDKIKISKIETLFQKYEKAMENKNDQTTISSSPHPSSYVKTSEDKRDVSAIAQRAAAEGGDPSSFISIDDFAKVELRVGQIISCEIVEKSDKLLKLQVDFGDFGKRQIFSGMRKYFKPEDLTGKQAVFVVNFKPRMIMGMESQGMMLTADDSVIVPSKQVKLGEKVK